MAQKSEQQIVQGQQLENAQNNQQAEELSEVDKKTYQEFFKSLNHMDKKVQNAKTKLHKNDHSSQQTKNNNFKEIVQKLIESKQNSSIVNKEDLLTDINQSYERAVIDVYSQNQKMKKKIGEMQKTIKEQNHKMFEQQRKEEELIKQIQKLKLELAHAKDHNVLVNRGVVKGEAQQSKKQQAKKTNEKRTQNNQNSQDYDFWSTPQNQNYGKKKKQFVENSGLWVNQKNIGDSMFITEGKR